MDRGEQTVDGLPRRRAPASGATAGAQRALRQRGVWRRHRGWAIAFASVAMLAAALVAAGPLLKEPVRRRMEATLNQDLKGYTATLPDLELHLWSLSLALIDLTVRQNQHPDPPVIEVDRLEAGVHWQALLSLRLVADLHAVRPRLHVDRRQLSAEASDPVAVQDKGWQAAVESIYPLKFNQVRISDGAMTYVDDPHHPVRLTGIELVTTNIRNVRSAAGTFPSPLNLRATVFDRGQLAVDGAADYLATPDPAIRAGIVMKGIPLDRTAPIADDVSLQVHGGVLSADGQFESVKGARHAHLRHARVSGLAADYVHDPRAPATRRAAQLARSSAALASQPTVRVDVDELRITDATLGVVDRATSPAYRVFFDQADVRVLNVSNQTAQGRGWIMLRGRFMGSGPSDLWTSFVADRRTPDLNVSVQIRDTDMRTMNDLLQAYGDFDVVGGTFSLFSELSVNRGKVDGYLKPIFTDMDVYDTRQERNDSLGQKLYEGVVGGVAGLLRNREDSTATRSRMSGDVAAPELSTWEIIVNLVRNAFFDSILPGLEHSRARRRTGRAGGSATVSQFAVRHSGRVRFTRGGQDRPTRRWPP